MNLDAYAAANSKRSGPKCGVCIIPEILENELHRHELRGTPRLTMSKYLLEQHGINVGQHTIGRHFREGHHKEAQ